MTSHPNPRPSLLLILLLLALASTEGTAQSAEVNAPVALGVYDFHACVLRADATVWCWGANFRHQLADGDTDPSALPVEVHVGPDEPLTGVARLSTTGNDHTCAVMDDTTVRCWGWNVHGQLGYGTKDELPYAVTVVRADTGTPLRRVTAVALGRDHSCALRRDGTVWCWGSNKLGQLGNGTTFDHASAVQVRHGDGVLSDIRAIGSGLDHTCAIVGFTRTLWCWGDNSHGKLGDGTTDQRLEPVRVRLHAGPSLTDVVSVQGGYAQTCAARSDGSAWCWGGDGDGTLGNGPAGDSVFPVRVRHGSGFLTGVRSVDAGWFSSCATTIADAAWCWGTTTYGELGIGEYTSSTVERATRVRRTGGTALDRVRVVRAGDLFGCALLRDATVWCFGRGNDGEMGNGTFTEDNDLGVRVHLP